LNSCRRVLDALAIYLFGLGRLAGKDHGLACLLSDTLAVALFTPTVAQQPGDRYTDGVASFWPDRPASEHWSNPQHALGQPDFNGANTTGWPTVGAGGSMTVEFVDNVTVDGPGIALEIVGDPGNDERWTARVSTGGQAYRSFGPVSERAQLDLANVELSEARFVRLTDDGNPSSGASSGAELDAAVALNGRRTGFQQALPGELIGADGEPLTTLHPTSDSVLVTVSITRTFDTREAAVQAKLETGSLETGFQVTDIRLSPSEVTLTGQQADPAKAGESLATLPINLADVFNSLESDVPLILPEGVSALNYQGQPMTAVLARVTVSPAAGYLALGKVPTESGVRTWLSAGLSPESVTVLLVGLEPLRAQVEKQPSLVLVSLSLAGYGPGSHLLPWEVRAPEALRV
jgi:hypothetical protein